MVMVPDNGPYGFERDKIAPRGHEKAYANTCVLNRCRRPQGLGTWATVTDSSGNSVNAPVCEEHWQALRDVR